MYSASDVCGARRILHYDLNRTHAIMFSFLPCEQPTIKRIIISTSLPKRGHIHLTSLYSGKKLSLHQLRDYEQPILAALALPYPAIAQIDAQIPNLQAHKLAHP